MLQATPTYARYFLDVRNRASARRGQYCSENYINPVTDKYYAGSPTPRTPEAEVESEEVPQVGKKIGWKLLKPNAMDSN